MGKDTTIQFIRDWAAKSDPTPSVVRRGFADKMKWAYMRMWVPDCTMEWAVDFIDQYKNNPNAVCIGITSMLTDDKAAISSSVFIPSVVFRNHMDHFATESAREVYGDDHWVDMLLPLGDTAVSRGVGYPKWYESFESHHDPEGPDVAHICCINDLRAHNEVARVEQIPNSLKVKIKRRDREEEVRAQYGPHKVHLFAQELPDELFDVVIVNNDNDMDNARNRTYNLMHQIRHSGVAAIKRGIPSPWVIQ